VAKGFSPSIPQAERRNLGLHEEAGASLDFQPPALDAYFELMPTRTQGAGGNIRQQITLAEFFEDVEKNSADILCRSNRGLEEVNAEDSS
jgi:hypothetical protein